MIEISCLTICMPLYKNYRRNDPRTKQPKGETTHVIRANRPTPKTRAKRSRAKRPGETTHGRNNQILRHIVLFGNCIDPSECIMWSGYRLPDVVVAISQDRPKIAETRLHNIQHLGFGKPIIYQDDFPPGTICLVDKEFWATKIKGFVM